eukprot:1391439-Amorphochlora_amoeboformis.AAC.3
MLKHATQCSNTPPNAQTHHPMLKHTTQCSNTPPNAQTHYPMQCNKHNKFPCNAMKRCVRLRYDAIRYLVLELYAPTHAILHALAHEVARAAPREVQGEFSVSLWINRLPHAVGGAHRD